MPTERSEKPVRKVFRQIFKVHGFRDSLLLAFKGVGYLFVYHRNMRLIFLMGLCSIVAGFQYNLKGIELVALSITITLVLMAEIFNTAVELMVDMFTDKFHPLIKLILDISAAVVVIACVNAIAVGYILFLRKIF